MIYSVPSVFPSLVLQLWLTGYELGVWGHSALAPEVPAQVQSRLKPLHTEVKPERDGVVLVTDPEHVANLKS